MTGRETLKRVLAHGAALDRGRPRGATLLIWHRVGGGTNDELDLPAPAFEAQLDTLVEAGVDVLSLDGALDRLAAADPAPSVVLTFDDGFAEVHAEAWPRLQERGLPFTVYVAAGLVGGAMRCEGSTGGSQGAPALTWDQLAELHESGLTTIANHTFDHSRPADTDAAQLDRCGDAIADRLGEGARPRHFAWTWGVEVPALRPEIAARFRSAATGKVGRNLPGADLLALRRVPVRRTDPLPFFAAKLRGRLLAERAYASIVTTAKALRG